MSPELPASALYSHPSLARLWKKVHLTCSPFYRRPAVRRLYTQPTTVLRFLLRINIARSQYQRESLFDLKSARLQIQYVNDIDLHFSA